MAQYTALPWKIEEEPTGKGSIAYFIKERDVEVCQELDDEPNVIAQIMFINGAEANAKLICVAPKLLEACQQMALVLEHNTYSRLEREQLLKSVLSLIVEATE